MGQRTRRVSKKSEPFHLSLRRQVLGVPMERLERVAKEIPAAETLCILWAMGITQHVDGSDASTAISNLLLITGNYMKPGCGAYPLRGHNNVQGASDVGAMPNNFPGYQSVTDDAIRKRFEDAWKVQLPKERGLDNYEMVNAMHAGKLHALYLAGEDMIDRKSVV